MKILITGAGGFLGQKLIEYYTQFKDVRVVGITHHFVENVSDNVDYIQCDILDTEAIRVIFERNRFDAVIHLAAITAHSEIVDNKYEALDINLRGTENLLRIFNQYCSGALFVYASTGKVYGETNELPITEKSAVKPMNILGKSKFIAERIIDFYVESHNKYLITRIFQIYGGNQKDNFIVPTIVKQLKKGKHLVLGNLTDERDYLYIDDFVNAFTGCIENKEKLNNLEIINIGSGTALSVNDIIHSFEKCLGYKITVESDIGRFRNDEKSIEYCSNEKLKEITGWEEKYNIDEGVNKICIENMLKDRDDYIGS